MTINIQFVNIKNPFNPYNSREIDYLPEGKTVQEYIDYFYPLSPNDLELQVAHNGMMIDDLTIYPLSGDSIVFAVVPKGGGGSGGSKNTLKLIASIGVMVAAIAVSYYLGPAGYGFVSQLGANLIGAGVAVAGSIIVNALLPTANPALPVVSLSANTFSESPTYGWDTGQNPTNEGLSIPVLYGTMKIVPYLIGEYVSVSNNKQYLNLLYALCEGPINNISNVELSNNPISNYTEAYHTWRSGANRQGVISWFNDTITETYVGSKITATSYTTAETAGNNAERLVWSVTFPNGLYYANDSGSLSSRTVNLRFIYRKKGSSTWNTLRRWSTWNESVISHRWSAGRYAVAEWIEFQTGSTDPNEHYEGEILWDFNNDSDDVYWRWAEYETVKQVSGYLDYFTVTASSQNSLRYTYTTGRLTPAQYEIGVIRTTEDSNNIRVSDDAYLDGFQEIVYDDFTYPNTALLAVRALATDQLSGGIPNVTCIATKSYVSVYNGSAWVSKPATNPAWISYDILVNTRYGASIPASRMNYSEFETWANWCDSKGITCNIYFDTEMTIPSALNQVSQLGRGQVIQRGTNFGCIVDMPSDPVQMFTIGNIKADSFEETFLPLEERTNCIRIEYNDKDKDYSKQIIEERSSNCDTDTTVDRTTNIALYGCVDRTIAYKHAKFLLNCNEYLKKTISFEVDVDAIGCQVGDVIYFQHDIPQWGYGGRVVSSTGNTLKIDRPVSMEDGYNYKVLVRLNDDTLVEKSVLSVGGADNDELVIQCNWDTNPSEFDIYTFGKTTTYTKKFRVISIEKTQELTAKISALEYYDEIYSDTGTIPDYVSETELTLISSLTANEVWERSTDGSGQSVVYLEWSGMATQWYVFYKNTLTSTWIPVGANTSPYKAIYGLSQGITYDFYVSPQDSAYNGLQQTITILGKQAPPSEVENFSAAKSGDEIIFTWDHIPDIDRWGYEIRKGSTWSTGTTIINMVQENQARWKPPLSGTYRFWIKAKDETGNESVNATSYSITVNVAGLNYILNNDEVNTISGTLYNMIGCSTTSGIIWIPGIDDTMCSGIDDTTISGYSGDSNDGYYITPVQDLLVSETWGLRINTETSNTFRDITDIDISTRTNLTYPTDTDVSITANSSYSVKYRHSDNYTTITGSTWISYNNPVELTSRYYQVKWETDLETSNEKFIFTKLHHTADVEEQTTTYYNQTISGTTGTRYYISNLPFAVRLEYFVGISVRGTTALTPTYDPHDNYFDVFLFDTSGNNVGGTADITIRGY